MINDTSGYEAIFFMDDSFDYNQIRMAPKDDEFTIYHMVKGIYYYKLMPFSLKNNGATYQRDIKTYLIDYSIKILSVMWMT